VESQKTDVADGTGKSSGVENMGRKNWGRGRDGKPGITGRAENPGITAEVGNAAGAGEVSGGVQMPYVGSGR
jgi:hypothetical protein